MVKRRGLLSLTGIGLLGLIALMTLHEWDYSLPRGGERPEDQPSIILHGARAVSHKPDGNEEYEVEAETLTFFEIGQRAELTYPRVKLFGNDAQWQVSANKGEMDQDRKIIHLSGSVRARRGGTEPIEVTTDRMVYDARDERMTIPVPVEVHHPGGVTRAGELEADLEHGLLLMDEGVETRYAPPQAG